MRAASALMLMLLASAALAPTLARAQCPEGMAQDGRGPCLPMHCEKREDCVVWYDTLCPMTIDTPSYCGVSIACVPAPRCVVEYPDSATGQMAWRYVESCAGVAAPATCHCNLCGRSRERVVFFFAQQAAPWLLAIIATLVLGVIWARRRTRRERS